MKFFIPHAENKEQENSVYKATKKFAKETTGWDIKDRKIYHIRYRHNGKYYEAKVGEREEVGGEEVIVILESEVTFLVCTANRGVVRGMPILVGREEIISITDFEE